MRRFHLLTIVAVLVLLASGLAGCSDDPPPTYEDNGSSTGDKGAGEGLTPDIAQDQTQPDKTQPDQPPIWPDLHPIPDGTPQPDYSGTPFGCQTEADCFGQKCCATPWGIKLCAPTCM